MAMSSDSGGAVPVAAGGEGKLRRTIVCLCGSTRFMDVFHEANRRESLAGRIVLSVEIVTYDGADDPQRADPDQKQRLDALHLDKVAMADEVLILNVGGYVGPSTAQEVAHAIGLGKRLRWWENRADDGGWPVDGESYRRIRDAVRAASDGALSVGRVR